MKRTSTKTPAKPSWRTSARQLHRRMEKGEHIPLPSQRDLREMERLREKERKRYRCAEKIWLHMTPEERDSLREEILAECPFPNGKHSRGVEANCICAIRDTLD